MKNRHAVDHHVGERIRLRREDLRLSQVELAERLAIDKGELLAFERGERRIAPALMLELATALGVRVTFFFGDGAADAHHPDGTSKRDSIERHAGVTEYSRLLAAFDDIASLDDRRLLVELAEALTRGQTQ